MIEDIIKHLKKKNKALSQHDAEEKAKIILDKYKKQNKNRDDKRELEHQRRLNEALKWESYNTLFEYIDNYESDD